MFSLFAYGSPEPAITTALSGQLLFEIMNIKISNNKYDIAHRIRSAHCTSGLHSDISWEGHTRPCTAQQVHDPAFLSLHALKAPWYVSADLSAEFAGADRSFATT